MSASGILKKLFMLRYLRGKSFLHFGNVNHIPFREFLEFLVVDVCPVEGHNLIMLEMTGSKHEGVVGGCRGKLDIKRADTSHGFQP